MKALLGEIVNISGSGNTVISGNTVTHGTIQVTQNEHNSIAHFAEELARIRSEHLTERDDLAHLYRAVMELELASRANDRQTFAKAATKYARELSIPFFVHVASDPLLEAIRAAGSLF